MSDTSGFQRIRSIDIIRGAVMVLMAIDHVRVYSGVPAFSPEPAVFFTRWITHFCAPAFLFLAGTSAFLSGRKHGGLSRFLLTRGLWLVLLELTVLRLAWTFNLDFAGYGMAGVIWVIGISMIVMAGLVRLPAPAVGIIGLVIVAGHNLLDPVLRSLVPELTNDLASSLWKIFYVGFYAGPISFGDDGLQFIVLYAVVPWVGVMAAGYGFGQLLLTERAERDRLLLRLGLAATALFVVLRGFNLYGDPRPWGTEPWMPGFLSFLNTTKYPASLAFLLMTLGPSIAVMPWLERARGAVADLFAMFGRVPFFFYVLHIPLIHLLALGVSYVSTGSVHPWLFENHPLGNSEPPEGYTWSLGTLYLVFVLTIALLYVPCRWFDGVRNRRKEWWVRYL